MSYVEIESKQFNGDYLAVSNKNSKNNVVISVMQGDEKSQIAIDEDQAINIIISLKEAFGLNLDF